MSVKPKYRVLFALCLLVALVNTGFNEDSTVQLNVPKGWPKPAYNFNRNRLTKGGIQLGRKLFYDPILSRDGTISCANCHTQFNAFTHVDHGFSHGVDGLKGTRNSLALMNLAWNTSFMWDGGVNNLEVQPLAPITNPVEMDNTLENVVRHLDTAKGYRARFMLAFGDSAITGQRVLKALAQFTSTIVSCNAKYDKVMRGEEGVAFTEAEFNGLKLFRKSCASCHKEPLFTDFSFKNIGLALDIGIKDIGRMKITGQRGDSLKFKVPTLRNVAMTYPYMHDGRFRTLGQVLDHYTSGGVMSENIAREMKDGFHFTDREKQDIIAFLETLTDKDFLFNKEYGYYAD